MVLLGRTGLNPVLGTKTADELALQENNYFIRIKWKLTLRLMSARVDKHILTFVCFATFYTKTVELLLSLITTSINCF